MFLDIFLIVFMNVVLVTLTVINVLKSLDILVEMREKQIYVFVYISISVFVAVLILSKSIEYLFEGPVSVDFLLTILVLIFAKLMVAVMVTRDVWRGG